MTGPQPQPPGQHQAPRRPEPRPIFWIAVVALTVVLSQVVFSNRGRLPTLPYSTFVTQVEAGNVERVEVVADEGLIRGELKTAVQGQSDTRFQTVLPFTDPAPVVARLEARGVPIVAARGTTGWTNLLVAILPWVLFLGFWYFLVRRMSGNVQGASAFGQVGAKALAADRPNVTFADVAGADEAKAELAEIIEFLKDPGRFQRLGGRMPKGVLLVGPPGTGKTLLARAVAGEAQVPFFSISGSDFVEMFVGVGAARVRDLFAAGKRAAPSIIFIDELDAVGRLRGAGLGGGHDEREQTLNQLLVELDGFKPNEGVVLLSATNRPDVLDPALLRPGRFDRQVVVDLPDIRGREMILGVHARKVPLGEDVDLAGLARGTPGLSGADLANLVNEASILAARQAKQVVDMVDFEAARDKVMLGVERRSLVLSEDERRLTAYHEAGHALISVLVPGLDPLHKVTIVPRGRALGLTHSLPEEDRHSYPRDYLEARLVAAYGGRVAEELVFGPARVTTGAAQDIDQATQLARRMVTEFGMSDVVGPMGLGEQPAAVFLGRELAQRREMSERMADLVDGEIHQLVTTAYQKARTVLRAHLGALHAVAAALIERETLTGGEVISLVEREAPDSVAAPAARSAWIWSTPPAEMRAAATRAPFGRL